MRVLLAVIPMLLIGAQPPIGASRLVLKDSPEAARFAAVGKVGGCSGSIVRAPGAPSSAPALLLTAGHCIDLGTNDVIIDRQDFRVVELNYYIDGKTEERRRVRATRVLYSTMKGTDIALLELEEPLAAVPSLELSAEATTSVDWAGVPTARVPSEEQFLRTSPCVLGPEVDVLEWRWFWRRMWRNDCSDISGGASGSPLVSGSNRVIGVLTTSTVGVVLRDGDFTCWRDNPCETTGYQRDTSYAVQVAPLLGCFTRGVFDLQTPTCRLDLGRQAQVLESRLAVQPGARWNARVSSDSLAFYRYKTFRLGEGDCASEAGYSEPRPLVGTVAIDDPIGDSEGRYFLCVLAGDQPLRFATVSHIRVDSTKPVLRPELRFLGNSPFPTAAPPDLASIPVKFETSEQETCDEAQGYREIYPVPLAIPMGVRRLCLIAIDLAGNRSEPYRVQLQGPTLLPRDVVHAAGLRHGVATPGSWITLFGRGLEEGPIVLVDSAGQRHTLETSFFSQEQVNARVPEAAAIGTAVVEVNGQHAALLLKDVEPGIFSVNVQGRTLTVYASGLGRDGANLRVRVSAQDTELLEASEYFGVYTLSARLPDGVTLRGSVPVIVGIGSVESPEFYVRLN